MQICTCRTPQDIVVRCFYFATLGFRPGVGRNAFRLTSFFLFFARRNSLDFASPWNGNWRGCNVLRRLGEAKCEPFRLAKVTKLPVGEAIIIVGGAKWERSCGGDLPGGLRAPRAQPHLKTGH
jgi:hypothetical protein